MKLGAQVVIQVYPDKEAMSRAAAELFVEQAGQALRLRGRFCVALSGGNTPRRMYELLAQPPFRDRVAWAQVQVFWGDERCVPADDPRSNAHLARQVWLDQVPISPQQIHPVSGNLPPEAAARAYEALLKSFFAGQPPSFDLIFLGLGEDGHTASLFPDHEVLNEQVRWAAEVYLAETDLPRVTLTFPLINQAAVVALLVTGAAKARVLKEVLQGPREPRRLPAQLVHPQSGALFWLVDQEAASQLQKNPDIKFISDDA